MNNMIRALSENGGVVFCGVDSTNIVSQMEAYQHPSAVVTAGLGRLLTAASLIGIMMKNTEDSVTLRVEGDGPAGLLLAVEVAMYMLYCAASMLLLAAVAVPVWGVRPGGPLPAFLGAWALTMLSTLSIGLMVGALAKNSRQAGVIASVLYFPMLIFSGTTLPVAVMPAAMQRIVALFPLTQGITLMKQTFLGLGTQGAMTPVAVMALVTVVCTGLAVRFFRWE